MTSAADMRYLCFMALHVRCQLLLSARRSLSLSCVSAPNVCCNAKLTLKCAAHVYSWWMLSLISIAWIWFTATSRQTTCSLSGSRTMASSLSTWLGTCCCFPASLFCISSDLNCETLWLMSTGPGHRRTCNVFLAFCRGTC